MNIPTSLVKTMIANLNEGVEKYERLLDQANTHQEIVEATAKLGTFKGGVVALTELLKVAEDL